jgi:alkylated DNA nucleotide flippase Atl1
MAGYALRMMIDELHLPWHRVAGAGGYGSEDPQSARASVDVVELIQLRREINGGLASSNTLTRQPSCK